IPAIIGGASGLGNTVIIGYDWADGFSSSNADGKRLILNALTFDANHQAVTPEPTSLALAGFAGLGMAAGAWRRRRQQKQQAA
ncbi:MAG TPA: PEP-CTERM sorting domain-containing protein, partial [Planctomycetaceae bacterium]|nr:PEP-CTERM sorting domain-containing protein [Planctomycetaceae bacterium]